LVAIFLAIVNVLAVDFALDADLLVPGEVGKLNGHQRLEVIGVEQLPVIGVIQEGESAIHAKVLDLAHLPFVLLSLVCAMNGDGSGVEFGQDGGRELGTVDWGPGFEVHDPVELDQEAWLPLCEAILSVCLPRAGPQKGPAETASLPGSQSGVQQLPTHYVGVPRCTRFKVHIVALFVICVVL